MAIYGSVKSSVDFEKANPGTHQAVVSNVFDIGEHEQNGQNGPKIKHLVVVVWELDQRITAGDYAGQRFVLSNRYNLTMSKKSNLRRDVQAIIGRELTDDEAEQFDLETLRGMNAYLGVVNREANNKTYQDIKSIVALPASVPAMVPELDVNHIPEWIKKKQAERLDKNGESIPHKAESRPFPQQNAGNAEPTFQNIARTQCKKWIDDGLMTEQDVNATIRLVTKRALKFADMDQGQVNQVMQKLRKMAEAVTDPYVGTGFNDEPVAPPSDF